MDMLNRAQANHFDDIWTEKDGTWNADAVKDAALIKIKAEMKPCKRWRKKSLVVLLAAVIAVMGTISFGAERDWDIRFAEFIGVGDVMADLPGGYKEIGISQTVEDVTMTVSKVIGDANCQWILLETTLPWRGKDPKVPYFADFSVDVHTTKGDFLTGGYSAEPFEQKGNVSYLIEMMGYEDINRAKMTVEAQMKEDGEAFCLEWENYYAANTEKYRPLKWLDTELESGETKRSLLYSIEISPISIQVRTFTKPELGKGAEAIPTAKLESATLSTGEVISFDDYLVSGRSSTGETEGYLSLAGIASGSKIISVVIEGKEIVF